MKTTRKGKRKRELGKRDAQLAWKGEYSQGKNGVGLI